MNYLLFLFVRLTCFLRMRFPSTFTSSFFLKLQTISLACLDWRNSEMFMSRSYVSKFPDSWEEKTVCMLKFKVSSSNTCMASSWKISMCLLKGFNRWFKSWRDSYTNRQWRTSESWWFITEGSKMYNKIKGNSAPCAWKRGSWSTNLISRFNQTTFIACTVV